MIDLKDYCYLTIIEKTSDLLFDVCLLLDSNHKVKTKEHVLQVTKEAQRLAQQFHVDENICFQSALLHDISAIIKPLDMQVLALQNGYQMDESEKRYPFLLHQNVSKWIAQSFFNINNPIILDAIACHTTLKLSPNDYEMILFLADKIAWDQEGTPPYLDTIMKALDVSLEYACYQYIDYLFQNHLLLYPHHLIEETYDDMKEKYD